MKRVLLHFGKNDGTAINELDAIFFPLAILLQNLLSKYYSKNKLNEIVIRFYEEEYYYNYPVIPKLQYQYYKGYCAYYDVIDFDALSTLDDKSQFYFLWKRICLILKEGLVKIDKDLPSIIDKIYEHGLSIELNADFNLIEKSIIIGDKEYLSSLFIHFNKMQMEAIFRIENKEGILFEKTLEKSENGARFFLKMYKDILVDSASESLILVGSKEVEYLPMKVKIPSSVHGS